MKITAKVVKTFDTGNVKAIFEVTLDDVFAIHGVKLIRGQRGDFVSMPSDTWKTAQGDIKHNDIVHPLDSKTRLDLYNAVSEAHIASVPDPGDVANPHGFN